MIHPLTEDRAWVTYPLAAALVFTAFALRLAMPTSIIHEIPFLLFFSAVVMSGVFGGFRVGVFASILATLLASYFFVDTSRAIIKDDWRQNLKLFLFMVDCLTIAGLSGSLRSALQKTRALEASEHRSRHELLQSEERLRLALQGGQMGTWTIQIPGERVIGDPKFLELHGTSPEEDVDAIIDRKIHPADRLPTKARLAHAIGNRLPYSAEYRVLTGDSYRWIYARGEPKFGANGELSSVSGVAFDIQERKRTEEQLESARVEAERANEAKSAFLANMSHEIRTPLGAILGFVSLLKDPALPRSEIDRYLSIIDRNSTHLLRIIDDVLDLAKVEAGKIDVEKICFPLRAFLDDFTFFMEIRARESGIVFRSELDPDLPVDVVSDPTRLRQILTNIVGNAIKFTERGSVQLKARMQAQDLVLRVEDTGRGISAEQASQLFQAFMQGDSSTTRKFGGTGLGLVLTRRMAQALGGSFQLVTSDVGKGSVFEARIPMERPGFETSGRQPTGASIDKKNTTRLEIPALNDFRILLVEDSPDNQVLIMTLLKKTGAEVTTVDNGLSGVGEALRGDYDLVLMDIQMPIMDGHAAARSLRAKDYRGEIVALTAHAMTEERERTRQSGFSDFLSKPIDRKSLFELLSRVKRKKDSGSLV